MFAGGRYVACYVATELGKYEASPRIDNKAQYIVSRIMGCAHRLESSRGRRPLLLSSACPSRYKNNGRFPPRGVRLRRWGFC